MRRKAWFTVLLALCGALALSLVSGGPTGIANAKEFKLPLVQITGQINPDGSLYVTEKRTYKFSGDFHWASMWLPLAGETIENVVVAEDGRSYVETTSEKPNTYQVNTTSNRVDIKWFYVADDETRTFEISYLVRNAVQVYTDVAELYWQFIGKGWDVPTKQAEVTVVLPSAAPSDSIRVWGHGPLQGNVHVVNATSARWQIAGLPAHTFLEARMTFPPELVPQAGKLINEPGLPSILKEEEGWANQANRVRANARLDIKLALFALALSLLATVAFWYKFGRPLPSTFQGTYYRELPADYPPVVLGIFWRGYSSAYDMAATLLDLVRRKQLTVEPIQDGWRKKHANFALSLPNTVNKEQLTPNEHLLLELLFERVGGWLPPGEQLTIDDIKRYARKKSTSFNQWHTAWNLAAKRETEAYTFFDKSNLPGRYAAGVAAVVLTVVGIVLLVRNHFVFTGIAFLVAAFIALLCATLTSRHTPAARTQYLQWRAFRRFLQHFSTIKDAPVFSIAIWEHFLVYAVTLGVAKEVARQLKALEPQLTQDPSYTSSWLFIGMHHNLGGDISTFSDTFVASVQAAMSQASSSSGGGGGFSSGGGGGGGGGGGSAG